MSSRRIILGINIDNRGENARVVQDLLTQYAGSIKNLPGLHDVSEDFCSPSGVILLEMIGDEGPISELIEKLQRVDGVDVKKMVFEGD